MIIAYNAANITTVTCSNLTLEGVILKCVSIPYLGNKGISAQNAANFIYTLNGTCNSTIVDRNSPCIVDGSKPFVLRTISGYNDTYSVHPRKKINPKDNEFLNVTEKQNVLNLFGIYLNLANKNL